MSDKAKVMRFYRELDAAVKVVAQKFGYTVSKSGGNYSRDFTEVKLTNTFTQAGPGAAARKAEEVNRILVSLGYTFKFGDLVITNSGNTYKVVDATRRGAVVGERLGKKWRIHRGLARPGFPVIALDGPEEPAQILNRMREMMGEYSIEAVSADGEQPRSAVARMQSQGVREWKRLVSQLGRTPSFREMYPSASDSVGNSEEPCMPEGLPL